MGTLNPFSCVASCFPAVVYVNDTTRGGLCYYPMFNNAINGIFCRTEAGQTAAIIFLFVTMVVYLIGATVCLKLWRHEAARRYREQLVQVRFWFLPRLQAPSCLCGTLILVLLCLRLQFPVFSPVSVSASNC